jgi:hypothetical protein
MPHYQLLLTALGLVTCVLPPCRWGWRVPFLLAVTSLAAAVVLRYNMPGELRAWPVPGAAARPFSVRPGGCAARRVSTHATRMHTWFRLGL